jgi:hypothetical protein
MPYVIVARVEPKTQPLVVARVCRARIEAAIDDTLVHIVEKAPFEAEIFRNPGWTSTAWTYQLRPVAGGSLDGVAKGPFPDLSAIKTAIETHTADTCAIRVST